MGISCCNEKGLLEKDNVPSYEQNNNDNNKTKENDEHNASNESFEEKELLEKKETIGEGGFGKVILVKLVHRANAPSPIVVTFSFIITLFREAHPSNAPSATLFNGGIKYNGYFIA